MDPDSWRDMVDRTRELERALGSANKRVAENESHTVIVQQRCLRAGRDIKAGETFTRDMIHVLRPAPSDAIRPYEIESVIGLQAIVDISFGEALLWSMLGAQ